jgi:putative transcriptional regulator
MEIRLGLKKLLDDRGKSILWLANETGITYTAIHNLVTKEPESIRLHTLAQICEALDCEPNDVLVIDRGRGKKSSKQKD